MGKRNIAEGQTSGIVWDNPEEWAHRKAQEFVQSLSEEEVTGVEFPGHHTDQAYCRIRH